LKYKNFLDKVAVHMCYYYLNLNCFDITIKKWLRLQLQLHLQKYFVHNLCSIIEKLT
jgi:hypothetical protein